MHACTSHKRMHAGRNCCTHACGTCMYACSHASSTCWPCRMALVSLPAPQQRIGSDAWGHGLIQPRPDTRALKHTQHQAPKHVCHRRLGSWMQCVLHALVCMQALRACTARAAGHMRGGSRAHRQHLGPACVRVLTVGTGGGAGGSGGRGGAEASLPPVSTCVCGWGGGACTRTLTLCGHGPSSWRPSAATHQRSCPGSCAYHAALLIPLAARVTCEKRAG